MARPAHKAAGAHRLKGRLRPEDFYPAHAIQERPVARAVALPSLGPATRARRATGPFRAPGREVGQQLASPGGGPPKSFSRIRHRAAPESPHIVRADISVPRHDVHLTDRYVELFGH